jgi:hypothetical protein
MKNIFIVLLLLSATAFSFGSSFFWGSPNYTAQAEYTIKWEQMWGGDVKFRPKLARQEYDTSLAWFKPSPKLVSWLRQNSSLPADAVRSWPDNLRSYLTITRIGSVDGSDLYRIQFADNNREVAVKTVRLVRKWLVEKLNSEAQSRSVANEIDPLEDYFSTKADEDKQSSELASLSQQQEQEYSAERQERINELHNQSELNQVKLGFSKFNNFIHVMGIFSNPAAIHGCAEVVKS